MNNERSIRDLASSVSSRRGKADKANPLDNIANTERRAGVMVRGRWLPEAELKLKLDEIALRFQAAGDAEK